MIRYCKRIYRLILKFFNIDRTAKKYLIKATIYTAYFRACILFRPFKKLKAKMGVSKEESPKNIDCNTLEEARKISWIVNTVAKHTPWESKCLVQALTAQKFLKSKSIKSTLYLGVAKDKNDKMIAHAWIRCGTYYVTGGINKDQFTVVAKFCA